MKTERRLQSANCSIKVICLFFSFESSFHDVNFDVSIDDSPCFIINIVRRPGCGLCREFAGELSDLAEFSIESSARARLVAVIHEKTFPADIEVDPLHELTTTFTVVICPGI